jgi:hypothetical protein
MDSTTETQNPAETIRRAATLIQERSGAATHPGVALAVAEWLETEAHMADLRGNSFEGQTFHALKVARAYLGEPDGRA